MDLCIRSKIASAFRVVDDQLCLFVVPCHGWKCLHCGPIKRRILIHRIIRAKPNTFLTLTTCPLQDETPRQTFDRTRRQLSLLFRHFKRTNRPGEYVRVIEQTKKGYPHYHCLVRTSNYWPQAEISEIWYKMTGAYVVDVRAATGDHAIEYVSKYMTKESIDFSQQRISRSRNFFAKVPKKDEKNAKYRDFKLYREHPADVILGFSQDWHAEKVAWQAVYELHDRFPGSEWPEELEPYLFCES